MRRLAAGGTATRRRTRLAPALVSLLAALVLAGCGGSDESTSADEGAPAEETQEVREVTVVLPVPLGLFWSAYIVAADRFYPEHGIEVEFVSVDGSASAVQQIALGNGFAASVATQETYVAATKDAEIVGIANFGHGLVDNVGVPDDSPVQSLEELEGEAIGVPSASDGSVTLVKTLMTQLGVSEGSYELPAVGAGGPAVAAALRSGRIVAYAHGISDVAALKVKGGITLRSLMPPQYQDLPSDGLVVSKSTMEDPEDREVAIALARGYLQGAQFILDNPDEAREIVCDNVPQECQDDELVAATMEVVATHYRPNGGGESGQYDYEKIENLMGLLDAELSEDISEVFTNDYIEQINEDIGF
jgi:NitT/TauT family transport system substrate-binding protein